MKAIVTLFGFFIVLPVLAVREKRQAQLCNTPDNFIGVCVLLPNCPSIVNLYGAAGGSAEVVQYIKGVQRNCGTRSIRRQPIVCCKEAYRGPQRMTTQWRFPETTPILFPAPITTNYPSTSTTSSTTTTTSTTTPSTTTSTTYLPPTSAQQRQDSCFGPDAKTGTCKALSKCPILLEQLRENQGDPDYAKFLRISNEICNQPPPVVCCPTESALPRATTDDPDEIDEIVTKLPTPGQGCGVSNNTLKRIVGGEASKPGAWPWIALLGYDDPLAASPFKCGGALITKRHVLTAAHCIRKNLRFVRLGEYDLDTEDDAKHVDVDISKVMQHPDYSRRDGHSDVAVLALQKNVPLSNIIQPICLPVNSKLRSKSFVDYNPFVAGWGKTIENGKSSNVLLEIQIPVHENQVCQDLYARQNKWISYKQFDDAIICAGVLSGGKDTCQGDSGGPLMIPEMIDGKFYYNAIGIVSYGLGCARPEVPGVYSNVSNFLDWIEEKVAET